MNLYDVETVRKASLVLEDMAGYFHEAQPVTLDVKRLALIAQNCRAVAPKLKELSDRMQKEIKLYAEENE